MTYIDSLKPCEWLEGKSLAPKVIRGRKNGATEMGQRHRQIGEVVVVDKLGQLQR